MSGGNIVIKQPKWSIGKNVLVLLLFSAFFVFALYKSVHEGWDLNFLEKLLQWLEIILLVIFLPLGLFLLTKMFSKSAFLVLKENGIDTKGTFTKAHIKYKDIASVKVRDEEKVKVILIKLKEGSKVNLPATRRLSYAYNLEKLEAELVFSGLQLGDDFDKVAKFLKQKVR